MHSIDKAALYEDGASERSMHHSLGSSVTVSRGAFELLRLKDRAMDNTKEGITIADCRQVFTSSLIASLLPGQEVPMLGQGTSQLQNVILTIIAQLIDLQLNQARKACM